MIPIDTPRRADYNLADPRYVNRSGRSYRRIDWPKSTSQRPQNSAVVPAAARRSASDRFCPSCGIVIPGVWDAVNPLTAETMGFWVRFVSFVIDLVIVGVIQGASTAILVPVMGPLVVIPIYLISPLYFVLLTGLKGQTLGKMAMGVKIVNARGESPGIWRALLRETIGKFVSSVFFMLGYLWAGWDSRKRAWHDYIAGTYPIRKPGSDVENLEHPDSTSESF